MDKEARFLFNAFSSMIDAGFWQKISNLKVNELGLDDSSIPLRGNYTNSDFSNKEAIVNIEYNSFDLLSDLPPRVYSLYGCIENQNTIERFKSIDKQALLNKYGLKIVDAIKSGSFLEKTFYLSNFVILTFLDIKKYKYYYWCGFPAIKTDRDAELCENPKKLKDVLSPILLKSFTDEYAASLVGCHPYFLIVKSERGLKVEALNKDVDINSIEYFGFADPSSSGYPSWLLRNYLYCIKYHWCRQSSNMEINVMCLRDYTIDGIRNLGESLICKINLSPMELDEIKFVGWEKNERQKLGPRMVDLRSSMDPLKLAEDALDLNLKLMRWRIYPDLNLEAISSKKCLLLGAGTLGCNVARMLLGWGVRNITFVDNGSVSYSNPPRQTLFYFKDGLEGLKKAFSAAENLKKIFPGMKTEGHDLLVPMPGHIVGVSEVEKVRKDVGLLESLIQSHDVIFLLMDSRESRWLPSVMGLANNKIVMNAALGFDSYLVMRYPVRNVKEINHLLMKPSGEIPGCHLGCYFCTDVVAPGNSLSDRTLDQQCTVTRPGVSMMASSLLVELLASLLNHPDGPSASAKITMTEDDYCQGILGAVPHTVRGYLSRFQLITPAYQRFPNCSACSDKVIEAYRNDGFEFLLQVFNTPEYLETLTGLRELLDSTDNLEAISSCDSE